MTLQKLVANVRERFRATTSKSGSTLTLLTKNIIFSIGKLLTISSRDADFKDQDKPLQKMVHLLSRVFEHLSSAQFLITHPLS